MPRPDLVGITAFTLQANRAYEVATHFRRIVRRLWTTLWQRRKPLISLVGNLSYRSNVRLNRKAYADFKSNSRTKVIKWRRWN
jgi:hypothetical protein